MSDIPSFPYRWLWGERQIVSVANLTRADAAEFFAVARRVDIRTEVTRYRLEDANRALADLRDGTPAGRGGARALAPARARERLSADDVVDRLRRRRQRAIA